MKEGIHPESYRFVVFQDIGEDFSFLTRSCAPSDKTVTWTDGNEYPLITADVTSASHPFYTGTQRVFDVEGRIQKFQKKYARGGARKKKAAK